MKKRNKRKRRLFALFLALILGGLYLIPVEKGKEAVQKTYTRFLEKPSTEEKESISF